MNLSADYSRVSATEGWEPYSGINYYDYTKSDSFVKRNYLDVGHGIGEEYGWHQRLYLWVLTDKGLEVRRHDSDEIPSHETHWSERVIERAYRGRYDAGTGVASILKPERSQHRDVPVYLVTELRRTFPDLKKIEVYGDW